MVDNLLNITRTFKLKAVTLTFKSKFKSWFSYAITLKLWWWILQISNTTEPKMYTIYMNLYNNDIKMMIYRKLLYENSQCFWLKPDLVGATLAWMSWQVVLIHMYMKAKWSISENRWWQQLAVHDQSGSLSSSLSPSPSLSLSRFFFFFFLCLCGLLCCFDLCLLVLPGGRPRLRSELWSPCECLLWLWWRWWWLLTGVLLNCREYSYFYYYYASYTHDIITRFNLPDKYCRHIDLFAVTNNLLNIKVNSLLGIFNNLYTYINLEGCNFPWAVWVGIWYRITISIKLWLLWLNSWGVQITVVATSVATSAQGTSTWCSATGVCIVIILVFRINAQHQVLELKPDVCVTNCITNYYKQFNSLIYLFLILEWGTVW